MNWLLRGLHHSCRTHFPKTWALNFITLNTNFQHLSLLRNSCGSYHPHSLAVHHDHIIELLYWLYGGLPFSALGAQCRKHRDSLKVWGWACNSFSGNPPLGFCHDTKHDKCASTISFHSFVGFQELKLPWIRLKI